MTELLLVLIPIALVDATSVTPLGLVPLATILAGRRPYGTALAFLGGLYVSYFLMGIGFVLGLSRVFMRLNAWAAHRWNHPEPMDFGLEILLGLIMVVAGLKIADKRRAKQEGKQLSAGVSPAAAFGFGIMINVVGFPGALPFFAAADQILRADPPVISIIALVAIYVVVFLLPLGLIVAVRALLGSRGDAFMARIKAFFDTWGRRIIIVLLLVLGLLLTFDGTLYFLRSEPLVPLGWPGK